MALLMGLAAGIAASCAQIAGYDGYSFHRGEAAGAPGTGDASGTGGDTGTGGDGGPTQYGSEGLSCSGRTGHECQGQSCCQSIVVPGGDFAMGRSISGTDRYDQGNSNELPEHTATVASYSLDTFEVTVGRFRKFVEQYDGTPPPDGAGAHPRIAGTGWQSAWNANLPTTRASLVSQIKCSPDFQTWTDVPAGNEQYPINCVSWYVAFSFCIWDGGRLPTEAEWEYAAAGGTDNRLYPWGDEDPSVNTDLANDDYSDHSPFVEVGSHSSGNGRWGHRDLAGSMWEWVLDWYLDSWYSGAGHRCVDCANVTDGSTRVLRGSSWGRSDYLRAAARNDNNPDDRYDYVGLRCARDQ